MAATFVSGTTFSPGSTVNAAALEAIVTGATMSDADRSNLATGNYAFTKVVGGQPPAGQRAGEPWMANTTRWLMAQTSAGIHTSAQPYGVSCILAEDSASVSEGESLSAAGFTGTDLVVSKGLAANPHRATMIAAMSAQPGSRGVAILHGICRAVFSSAPGVGEAFQQDESTDGRFVSVGSVGSGSGPNALGVVIAAGGTTPWVVLRR